MLGLSTAAARSDLWRRIEILVLLQQQLYFRSVLLRVCTYKALLSPIELNGGYWKYRSIISSECCEFDKKN